MSDEATDGLAPSVLATFRAKLERILAFFRQRAKKTQGEKPRVRIRVVLPKPGVPGRGYCRPKFQSFSRVLHRQSGVVMVLFWQPLSHFSPWSPSSFVVDEVPYSCAEQYMMAEKTRLFQDHRTVERIMSSPSPSTCKRIGRGVRNFDSGVGDREKQNAVLSDTHAKFTQNPDIKKHLLSSDNKLQAESGPLDPVWGIDLRANDPRANNRCQWRGKLSSVMHFLPFAKLCDSETGSAHSASPS